ncbi:MAG: eCIS core domain-containing protein, partial [Pseudonocardiaceae bacterium]
MTTATREAARPSAVPLRPIPVPAQIQRCGGVQCAPGICDHNQDEKVHRFADGTPGPARIPATVAAVLRTPGQALDASTRGGMEERFGHDFGQVRVHTDAEAARSAQAIHAQAYTLGRHVVMGQGRYEPHTASGMRLLAHELTHVVQQGNPTTDTGPARAISHHHDPSEREADHVAGALTGSTGAPHRHEAPQIAAPGMLQRQDDDDFPFGGGDFGGGGAGGTFDGPATPTAGPATTRAVPVVCSRPLDFPAWTGLRNFRHAYINDPPANYAIRGLVSGNGVTTSCSTATDASGPPDEPATSICKPCQPAPGQSVADVSRCLRSTHTAYPNPNLYRNLPDPNDGWRHGPNSNSYAAAMARCCYAFSPAGLGRLPGWSHSPAGPCPTTVTPGESEGPVPGGG